MSKPSRAQVPTKEAEDASNRELDCKTCRFFYGLDLPGVVETLSPEELQAKAWAYSLGIFQSWVELNTILKRHEEVIRKRWMKKTYNQRSMVLNEVWPRIPPTHRPDFATLRHGCKRHRKRDDKSKSREFHLWPFINVEDLIKPEALIMYLNCRGRNLPFKFALADKFAAHNEKAKEGKPEDSLRMMLLNCKTPRSYGRLCTGAQSRCCGRIIEHEGQITLNASEGLQVLEIQARILDFLLDCSRCILKDHCLSNLAIVPSRSVPTLPADTSCTLASLATEAPYRLPQKLEPRRLLTLVRARKDAAEDHIWALREDPAYFASQVREWLEHSPGQILNASRQPHGSINCEHHIAYVANDMIIDAYGALMLWRTVQGLLSELAANGTSKDRMTKLTGCSWASFQQCFLYLDRLTYEMLDWPMNTLMAGICAAPTLRGGYVRDDRHFASNFLDVKLLNEADDSDELRFHRLFKLLFSPQQQDMHGIYNIVEEIQRAIDRDCRHLITAWLGERFSDLAMILEIRRQLDLFQPWATLWREGREVGGQKCGCNEDHGVRQMTLEFEGFRQVLDKCSEPLIDADPARFPYPVDKRRTEGTVNQMRQSERLLDELWDSLDEEVQLEMGLPIHEWLVHYFEEPDRVLQRTARWKAPMTLDVQPVDLPDLLAPHNRHVLGDTDPNARHARPSKASLLAAIAAKEKAKTRGIATPDKTEKAKVVPQSVSSKEPAQGRYLVSKRALKVFAALFHVSSDKQAPGEIPWNDFLHAMASLGFAEEKLMGSSWQFTPPENDLKMEQPIQFHEPHPSSKLRFWEAKKIGRRLNKTYGWTGEMFQCK